jgi:hypothetical protein
VGLANSVSGVDWPVNSLQTCSTLEFEAWFNEREFNPPKEEDGLYFDTEFDHAIGKISSVLAKLPDTEFSLHPYHNNSRFIDVASSLRAI